MRLDLHTHSNASDGQYSPRELVLKAKEMKVDLLALTDHDTVSGIAEARSAAEECGLPFLPGIEISTRRGAEIHILGLRINENDPALMEACRDYQKERLDRGQRICDFFRSRSIDINMDEVLKVADGAAVGRPHFAQLLLNRGIVKSKKEAFRRYLETPVFHRMTDGSLPKPEEAIRLIHESGGLAVLAHPGLLHMGRRWQESLVEDLALEGLDGIEAFYSGHEFMQIKQYRRLAAQHGLMVTAGSDYHGEKIKPAIELGMEVDAEKLGDIMASLGLQ